MLIKSLKSKYEFAWYYWCMKPLQIAHMQDSTYLHKPIEINSLQIFKMVFQYYKDNNLYDIY